jgi:hypothetical protein
MVKFRAQLIAMAGLDPAIHVFVSSSKDVDARHEAGHEDRHSAVQVTA